VIEDAVVALAAPLPVPPMLHAPSPTPTATTPATRTSALTTIVRFFLGIRMLLHLFGDVRCQAGYRFRVRKLEGSVTGRRQAKRSQTYTVGCPSTASLPSRSGTSSAGPNATTAFGSNGSSAARATGASGGPTIAISFGVAR